MMIRRLFSSLLIAVIAMTLFTVPTLAQPTEEEELPECPIFENESTDMRISYYVGEGLGYQRSGNLGQATDSFDCVVLVIDPDYVPGYMLRGAVLAQQRLLEEAVDDYTRAIQLDSSLIEAYNNRGVLYMSLGEYDKAEADFAQTLEINPDFIEGYNNQAILSALNEDVDGAITLLETAISRTNIANILADLKDPDRPDDAEFPEFDRINARPYALLGIMNSLKAMQSYEDYITLTRSGADNRIASAAGMLESQFTFELRLDDGSWLLRATYDPFNE